MGIETIPEDEEYTDYVERDLDRLDNINTDGQLAPEERGWEEQFSASSRGKTTTLWKTESGELVVTSHSTETSTRHGGTVYYIRDHGDSLEITELYGLDNNNSGGVEAAKRFLLEDVGVYKAYRFSTKTIEVSIDSDEWPEDEWEAVTAESALDFRFSFEVVSDD